MTLLTDKEARTLCCPFFRFVVNEQDVLQHRASAIYVHQSCHGSDCKIGWRWERDADFDEVDEEKDPPRGFCGAFGKPAGAP